MTGICLKLRVQGTFFSLTASTAREEAAADTPQMVGLYHELPWKPQQLTLVGRC